MMLDSGFRLRGKNVSSVTKIRSDSPMRPWSRETLGSNNGALQQRNKRKLLLLDSTRGTEAGGQSGQTISREHDVPSRMPPLCKATAANLANLAGKTQSCLRLSTANSTTNASKSVKMIGMYELCSASLLALVDLQPVLMKQPILISDKCN